MTKKHRRDYRFTDPDGVQWDSPLEFQVFQGFQEAIEKLPPKARAEVSVRRAVKGSEDTREYMRPLRSSVCIRCASRDVMQMCSYTPDLIVSSGRRVYVVEVKGFFQQAKRAAFRDFIKSTSTDVRVILSRDHKVGKGRIAGYLHKYCRQPEVLVWNPDKIIPRSWVDPRLVEARFKRGQ